MTAHVSTPHLLPFEIPSGKITFPLLTRWKNYSYGHLFLLNKMTFFLKKQIFITITICLILSACGGEPMGNTSVEGVPAGSAPVGSTSVGSTSVGSVPEGSTPVGTTPVGSAPVVRVIKHPGAPLTLSDLQTLKAYVDQGKEPWKSAYDQMANDGRPTSPMAWQARSRK